MPTREIVERFEAAFLLAGFALLGYLVYYGASQL